MTGAAFPCIVGIEDEDQHLFFLTFLARHQGRYSVVVQCSLVLDAHAHL